MVECCTFWRLFWIAPLFVVLPSLQLRLRSTFCGIGTPLRMGCLFGSTRVLWTGFSAILSVYRSIYVSLDEMHSLLFTLFTISDVQASAFWWRPLWSKHVKLISAMASFNGLLTTLAFLFHWVFLFLFCITLLHYTYNLQGPILCIVHKPFCLPCIHCSE